jgi:hypothetical protein
MTLLLNGEVLIAGGVNGTGDLNTTELFDPKTDTITAGPLMTSVHIQALRSNT